jgi:prohibitin 1
MKAVIVQRVTRASPSLLRQGARVTKGNGVVAFEIVSKPTRITLWHVTPASGYPPVARSGHEHTTSGSSTQLEEPELETLASSGSSEDQMLTSAAPRTTTEPEVRFPWKMVIGWLLALFGLAGCTTTIPTGMGGVEWTPTQGTLKEPLTEGFHVVSPFSDVYIIDLREQQRLEELEVLTNNGLTVTLSTSVLFQPIAGQLYQLKTQVETDYYSVLIAPSLRSSARKVVGRYSPEEVYSTKRDEVEREIFNDVTKRNEGKPVRVNSILIRQVRLPKMVETAIERKLEQEQKALEMEFVLDRERKEAERKKIEATGIADYQQIISTGLSDRLLEWKGIDATEKLATSSNSKIIVIGAGKGGLPVILNPGATEPKQQQP